MSAPTPGWTTHARVVRVIDGDTLEVDVTRRLQVRLLDCWAPESRTLNLTEKVLGLAAKAAIQKLLKAGDVVTVQFPTDAQGEDQDLAKIITMGRLLGSVWVDGKDVAGTLRKAGHAYATKAELTKALEMSK